MRYKKLIIILLLLSIVFNIGRYFYRRQHLILEQKSPCNDYTIKVYSEPMFFAMPGSGGAGSKMTHIIITNKWGLTVAKSSDDCNVMADDIHIEWDCRNNKVNFARARSIDLLTGKCDY